MNDWMKRGYNKRTNYFHFTFNSQTIPSCWTRRGIWHPARFREVVMETMSEWWRSAGHFLHRGKERIMEIQFLLRGEGLCTKYVSYHTLPQRGSGILRQDSGGELCWLVQAARITRLCSQEPIQWVDQLIYGHLLLSWQHGSLNISYDLLLTVGQVTHQVRNSRIKAKCKKFYGHK